MTAIEKEFMSLEEVAELMDVNYQLIYRLVRSGELRAARIGKVYRIQKADLEEFLQRSKAEAAGLVCGACGATYRSRHSVRHRCLECGAAICDDCWARRRVRRCREHEGGKGDRVKNEETSA